MSGLQSSLLASHSEERTQTTTHITPTVDFESTPTSEHPLWLSLYYDFVVYCSLFCLILFPISIINLVSNFSNNSNEGSLILNSSILGNTLINMDIQAIVNFLAILFLIIVYQWLQHKQSLLRKRYDKESEDTAALHTIIIDGRYVSNFDDENIKDKIRYVWDIKKRFYTTRIEEKIIKIRRAVTLRKSEGNNEKDNLESSQMEQMREEANRGLQEYLEKQIQSRVVFVMFGKRETVSMLMRENKKHWIQRFCLNFTSLIKEIFGNEINETILMRSPEPEDIIFENFGFGLQEIYRSSLWTWLASILVISGVFILSCVLKTFTTTSKILSNLILIIIFLTNQLLTVFIEKYTNSEKPRSFTEYATSVASKLTIAMIFNTVFVMFIVQYFVTKTNEDGSVDWNTVTQGWVDQMFSMSLINAAATVLSPLIKWVKLKYEDSRPVRCFKRMAEAFSKTEAKERNLNDASEIYHKVPIELAEDYASIMKTMMMTALFAPFLPITVFFSLTGLLVCYLLDKSKTFFARRIGIPCRIGKDLSKQMNEILKWFVVFFAVGNLVVIGFGNLWILPVVGLVLSVFQVFLPVKKVRKWLLTRGKENLEEGGDRELSQEMIEKYMHVIPVYYDMETRNVQGRVVQGGWQTIVKQV